MSKIKIIFLLFLSIISISCSKLKILQIEEGISSPQSCAYHRDHFYISNSLNGEKGWISKVDKTGKRIYPRWLDELKSPQGISIHGEELYYLDNGLLSIVDLKTRQILLQKEIKNSKSLSDLAIDQEGNAYITDPLGRKVFFWNRKEDQVSLLLKDMNESPKGVAINGNKIIISTWGQNVRGNWTTGQIGQVLELDLENKNEISYVTKSPLGHLDGVAIGPNGKILVSGKRENRIFVIDQHDGKIDSLFKSAEEILGPSDLSYDSENRYLCIPLAPSNQIKIFQIDYLKNN